MKMIFDKIREPIIGFAHVERITAHKIRMPEEIPNIMNPELKESVSVRMDRTFVEWEENIHWRVDIQKGWTKTEMEFSQS